jgi:hypothetical protein
MSAAPAMYASPGTSAGPAMQPSLVPFAGLAMQPSLVPFAGLAMQPSLVPFAGLAMYAGPGTSAAPGAARDCATAPRCRARAWRRAGTRSG